MASLVAFDSTLPIFANGCNARLLNKRQRESKLSSEADGKRRITDMRQKRGDETQLGQLFGVCVLLLQTLLQFIALNALSQTTVQFVVHVLLYYLVVASRSWHHEIMLVATYYLYYRI